MLGLVLICHYKRCRNTIDTVEQHNLPSSLTAENHDLRHFQQRQQVLFVLSHREHVPLFLVQIPASADASTMHSRPTHEHLLICRTGLSCLEVCNDLLRRYVAAMVELATIIVLFGLRGKLRGSASSLLIIHVNILHPAMPSNGLTLPDGVNLGSRMVRSLLHMARLVLSSLRRRFCSSSSHKSRKTGGRRRNEV